MFNREVLIAYTLSYNVSQEDTRLETIKYKWRTKPLRDNYESTNIIWEDVNNL